MSALVRLYPRPWRERYETEFLALLVSRPPSIGDRLDIVRGAIDARLHPELPGGPQRSTRATPVDRIAAASSIAAGALWLAWLGLIVRDFRGWGEGETENQAPLVALSIFVGLALATAHVFVAFAARGVMRPIGGIAASVAAVSFTLTAFGGGTTMIFALLGSAVLAGAMVGRGLPTPVAVVWAMAALMVVTVFLAFVAGQGRDVGLLALGLSYGLSWMLVGAVIGWRGVPAPTDGEPGAVL